MLDVFALIPQAWHQGSSTPIHPGGGGRNGDLILKRTRGLSSLLSSQVSFSSAQLILYFILSTAVINKECVLFIEIDVGVKKDALLPVDGSSLEALLKGESVEKRLTTELRVSEEDSNQSDYTGGLNPAARIRKVLVFS